MVARRSNLRGNPENLSEFDPRFQINKRLRKIGELQNVLNSLTRGTVKKIQELKDALGEECKPRAALIEELLVEIFTLAKKHRKELGKGKWKKVIGLEMGIIGWRFTSYGTVIQNAGKVITWMEKNGFGKYIRMVPEIDRQLLIRNRAKVKGKIPGVAINRTEEFGAEPATTKVRIALPVMRLDRLAQKAAKKKR